MKIYDKKLSSLRDLRKERLKLKSRLKGSGSPDPAHKQSENGTLLTGLLSGITSGSALGTVFNIAPTIIDLVKKRSDSKKISAAVSIPGAKKSKNIGAGVLTDFITGYIKWKVLELSYKGLRKALKSDTFKSVKDKAVARIRRPFKK